MSATPVSKVNKEAIRLLVAMHGQREAARLSGLNENTVKSWASRYGWSHLPNAPKPHPVPARTGITEQTTRIADRLASNEKQTRLSLSRAHRLHAARAARGKLSPKETLQTAQGAAITHGWRSKEQTDQAQVAVNIAILSV